MIRGVHTMFYTSEPEKLRAFFRDKLGFRATDVGDGWLIFDVPEADLGCHPSGESEEDRSGTPSISFYCDDIQNTVADLKKKGVQFTQEVEDHGYGLVTFFKAPGDFAIQLYQPKYQKS
jgi:catechol 2,3-dioxygenase-like lactoylglutathione lyase family enzyme